MKNRIEWKSAYHLLPQRENRFMRVFYVLAAAPVVLLAEVILKSSAAAAAASAVLMISILASMVAYGWAMFKEFHHSIFCEGEKVSWIGVVSKLATAVMWLAALTLIIAAILFLHTAFLNRMPEAVLEAGSVRTFLQFINDTFGKGSFLFYTAASLFLQAIVLISITYAAAAASHLRLFDRYKALAGIFVFVFMYFFENDFAAALKRVIVRGLGGIDALLSQNVKSAVGAITGIEFGVYLFITAINISLACYFLNKIERGEVEWKR